MMKEAVYFQNSHKHETFLKWQGNSLSFSGSIDYNVSATSGTLMSIKIKWCLMCKRSRCDEQEFIALLPRSLDLTPCNIFLYGYVKEQIYQPPGAVFKSEFQAMTNVDETATAYMERILILH
jgi:hypothetical protein